VDDDTMQFLVIVFVEKVGIRAYRIKRDDKVAMDGVTLVIVEGDDVRIVVVTQILTVNFQDMLVVTEQIAYLPHFLTIRGSHTTYPSSGLTALDIRKTDVLGLIGNH
jgi:hypothetical protein